MWPPDRFLIFFFNCILMMGEVPLSIYLPALLTNYAWGYAPMELFRNLIYMYKPWYRCERVLWVLLLISGFNDCIICTFKLVHRSIRKNSLEWKDEVYCGCIQKLACSGDLFSSNCSLICTPVLGKCPA